MTTPSWVAIPTALSWRLPPSEKAGHKARPRQKARRRIAPPTGDAHRGRRSCLDPARLVWGRAVMPRSTEGCSSPSPPRHTIKPSNAGGHAVQYGCSSLSPPRHTIKSTSAGVSPPTVKSLTLCFESAEWVGATDGAALSAADLGACAARTRKRRSSEGAPTLARSRWGGTRRSETPHRLPCRPLCRAPRSQRPPQPSTSPTASSTLDGRCDG